MVNDKFVKRFAELALGFGQLETFKKEYSSEPNYTGEVWKGWAGVATQKGQW